MAERLGLRFSGHARQRMARRRITTAEVAEAWAERESTYLHRKPSGDRLVILGATSLGRRLKVVVLAAEERFVITVADRDDPDEEER